MDRDMQRQNRLIALLLNNFSGHFILYEPKNIELVYFEPNITSHIQPNNAGIIRCLKALYRKSFAERAIDLDDAGERNIWKINLLEAMRMAERAWDQVNAATIENCWRHTGIVPEHPNPDDAADDGAASLVSELSGATSAKAAAGWAAI
jgi:hypothetical protein